MGQREVRGRVPQGLRRRQRGAARQSLGAYFDFYNARPAAPGKRQLNFAGLTKDLGTNAEADNSDHCAGTPGATQGMLRLKDQVRLTSAELKSYLALTGDSRPQPKTVAEHDLRLESAAQAWESGNSAEEELAALMCRDMQIEPPSAAPRHETDAQPADPVSKGRSMPDKRERTAASPSPLFPLFPRMVTD